jgi:hypothetical protein
MRSFDGADTMSVMKRTLLTLVLFAAPLPVIAGFGLVKSYPQEPYNPNSIAVADFNGDGRDDVAATDEFCSDRTCSVMVFYQTAGGTYAAPVILSGTDHESDIQAGDFNGDGRVDIAVAAHDLFVYLQQPGGTFAAPVRYDVSDDLYDLSAGDVDRDGRQDIVAMPWGGSRMHVFAQQKDGTLRDTAYPMSGSGYDDFDLADLNGDGALDAIDVSGRIHVAYGRPAGGFDPPVEIKLPWSVTADSIEEADFNGDGRVDLAIITYGGSPDYQPFVGLLLQTPAGTFEAGPRLITYHWPHTLLVRDLNGNGRADIAVAAGDSIQMWMQTASGTFLYEEVALPLFSNFAAHDHLAVGDANGDGVPDLLVGLDNGALAVFDGIGPRRRTVSH